MCCVNCMLSCQVLGVQSIAYIDKASSKRQPRRISQGSSGVDWVGETEGVREIVAGTARHTQRCLCIGLRDRCFGAHHLCRILARLALPCSTASRGVWETKRWRVCLCVRRAVAS